MQNYNHKKGILYALFTAFLWGFLAIVIKVSVAEVTPTAVVLFRFMLAFFILFVGMFFFDKKSLSVFRKPSIGLLLCAVFLSINYYGFIVGVKYTSPINAQIFIQIGPVVFAAMGIVLFKELLNRQHLYGFLVFLLGYVIFYIDQYSRVELGSEFVKGVIFIIVAGLSWSIFAILQKRELKKYTPNQINVFMYFICTLIYLPFVHIADYQNHSYIDWLLLVFMGVNTVLAYGSLALANKYTEANKVSIIITLNPIITFIFMGILVFTDASWITQESFSILTIVGAITALIGALLVIRAGVKAKVG